MTPETITIKTPITNTEVELYKWITGRKAEYIQEPILAAVKFDNLIPTTKNDMTINGIDAKTAIQETAHRKIESYVTRVGAEIDPKNCLEMILDMPESDYNFINEEIQKIEETSKKK